MSRETTYLQQLNPVCRFIRNFILFSVSLLGTFAQAQESALTPKDVSGGWVGKTG